MSHKKSRRARRALQAKMERIAQMNSLSKSQSNSQRRQSFAGTFDDINSYVAKATREMPLSAVYWGAGAVVLGAAAIGAYVYRGRLLKAVENAYESIVESPGLEVRKTKPRAHKRAPVAKSRKSTRSNSASVTH